MSITNYPQKKEHKTQNDKIVVILGQTATGKSDLAVILAKKFKGEIISADSRQVYRGLNLGTGKITRKEMSGIPHHLLDVASPSRRFSVAQYKRLGEAVIKKIQNRNKLPIICGGTGFYIQALIDKLELPVAKPDFKLRAKLEKKTAEELFKELKKLDPRRAKNIDCHNPRRLIRALEIIYQTGQPVPTLVIPGLTRNPGHGSRITAPATPARSPLLCSGISGREQAHACDGGRECGMTNNNVLFLGIKKSRSELAPRIKIRLEKRLKQGMLGEVKKLRAGGLSWKKLEDFGLEYRWLARYLQNKIEPRAQAKKLSSGETKLSRLCAGRNPAPKANPHTPSNKWPSGAGVIYKEMIAGLQKDIEHYAKRQLTWFGRDERIIWIKNKTEAIKKIRAFLS